MSQRRGGTIQFATGGVTQDAKGAFTYNLGIPKRDAIMGADGVHGFAEKPQVAFIEGAITDRGSLDMAAFMGLQDVTITLALANGKTILLTDAWNAGEGTGNTEEGEMAIRFESKKPGQEV